MKPDRVILNEQDKTELHAVAPVKKQVLFDREKIHRGHKIFEINTSTLTFKVADFTNNTVQLISDVILLTREVQGYSAMEIKKIFANKDCVYVSALNRKSMAKKIMKIAIKQMEGLLR